MKTLLFTLFLMSSTQTHGETPMATSMHEFSVQTPQAEQQKLSDFKGKVALVVNVASKCGFTPQYKELEELYTKFKDKGFVVLAFPCNQFGGQEPGSNQEIQTFCKTTYGVEFPVFAKIEVNGKNADPLYKWLKASAPGIAGTEAIKWNFTKFLVDKNGKVLSRYAPQTSPKNLVKDIEKALAQ